MDRRGGKPKTDRPAASTLLRLAVAVVLVGSLLPLPGVGGTSLAPLGVGADKWVHALGYALLGWFAAASREWRRHTLAVIVVVFAVTAFGAAVEVAQSVVPWRSASAADAVANAVGAVAGVAGWWLFVRRRAAEATATP